MYPYAANDPASASSQPESLPRLVPFPRGVGRPWSRPAVRETTLTLGPVETAPKYARGTLTAWLKVWGLSHLSEVGEVIISELVTNALVASHEAAPRGAEPGNIIVRLTA